MAVQLVCIENLQRSFGAKRVLDSVSLTLGEQTVFGLVGLNGAGKTTLIRMMPGLLRPGGGTCRILDSEPWRHGRDFYRSVGVVLENHGLWGNLDLAQNLEFFAEAKGIGKRELKAYIDAYWAGTPVLQKSQKVKYFSRGEKMQCALCRAFLGKPRVFLLDEPAVALDVKAYDHFCMMIRQARAGGATVLISSHQLDAIEDLCDSVGILENGRLTMLDGRGSGACRWSIRTDGTPECGAEISRLIGAQAQYSDGAWRFSLDDAHRGAIPAIIARLAEMGCTIHEARRESDGLRESIRTHYAGQG